MRSKLLVALSVLTLAMPVSCTFKSTSETPEPASTAEPTEAKPKVILTDNVRLEPLKLGTPI